MRITLGELRQIISEAIDDDSDDFNDTVDELMKEPHMKDVESFVEYKYEEEEETYSTLELQALARNLYLKDAGRDVKKGSLATAPAAYRDRVKGELNGYGLKFSPRDTVSPWMTRLPDGTHRDPERRAGNVRPGLKPSSLPTASWVCLFSCCPTWGAADATPDPPSPRAEARGLLEDKPHLRGAPPRDAQTRLDGRFQA
jgi:hypothetical protein